MKKPTHSALSADDLELVKESLSATIDDLVECFAHDSNMSSLSQQRYAIQLANKVRQVKRVLKIIDRENSPPDLSRGSVVNMNSSKELRRQP